MYNETNIVKLSEPNIFSARYWKMAAANFRQTKMILIAAIFIALRVAIKSLSIPIAAGLHLSLDCYINSIGSMIYGPLVGLFVGAISDTIGCILFPTGPYFFPFIFVEMISAFIFGLFFWKRELSIGKIVLSKFTINFVCNIILNSILMKFFYYWFYGVEKAEAYNLINGVRIVKNLVLFPLEAALMSIVIGAFLPALKALDLTSATQQKLRIQKKHIVSLIALTVLSVALVLLYVFWLKDFVSSHNIKLL